jgi:hypothetical protein
MIIFKRWQFKTALLMVLGMTSTVSVPILTSTSAIAGKQPYIVGQFSQSSRVIVAAGTTIPVRYGAAERIIITPKEKVSVTLIVAKNIRSNSGRILIPVGSQVKGQLKPVSGGTQFFAQELIFANSSKRLPIDAVSEIIAETKTINETTDSNIIKGAAVGAGAGAVIGKIFGGRIKLGQVLAGAGIGALPELLGRSRKETELVVIDPDTDLHLTLQSDLVGS